jgi:hypothetical protein
MRLRVPLFLVLILLVLAVLPVHASTYVGYNASNLGSATCGSNCAGPSDTTHGIGEIVKAPFTGQLTAAGFYVGSGAPTQIVIGTFAVGITPASTPNACGSPGTDAGVNGGQSFTVQDVEALTGVATQAFNTVNLASPVSVTVNQYVLILFMGGASTKLMLLGAGASQSYFDSLLDFATSSPVVGNSYSTSASAGQCGPIVGGSFTPSGSTNTIVAQCYGNCGSPAVTLANTNSTHLINFNQSITLFYIVQSNLNGFVANVTAQVAKTYSNGQTISIGLYTVDPTCTGSALPFTPQCPGFLAQHQGPASNPTKGMFSMTSSVAVLNGQWFGIAVTGAFQGLDLNDTNTNVVLSQASGQTPTVISQYANLGNSKAAVYAWVKGNSIISGPTGGQIPAGCQSVTCGILALWIALGGDIAAGLGAFLIVLGLVVGFMLYISRQHNPDGTIKGFAIPVEMLGIIAVVLLIMFSVAGAIPAWIPGVIIFLVAGFFVAGLWGHRRHANTVQG